MDVDDATRRDQWAGTVFSTWVVLGLFLDGWAHNAGKPEDFWTPWHAVLYSGLLAGAAWYARERRRRRRAGTRADSDPLVLLGFALFGVAGLGDAVWHGVFGVEEDVAALLSPTHLALMLGGLLLVTGPVRRAREHDTRPHGWRDFVHVVVATTLAVAVVAFFLQFLSAFHVTDEAVYTASSVGDATAALHGVASVLVTNAILLAGLTWLVAAWTRPPVGTVTAYIGVTALLLSGLLAFEHVVLVAPAVLAGVVADLLVAGGAGRRAVLVTMPLVLWTAWFGLFHTVWGLGWEVEVWTGTIVFAVLTGAALDLLLTATRPAPRSRPAPETGRRVAHRPAQPATADADVMVGD